MGSALRWRLRLRGIQSERETWRLTCEVCMCVYTCGSQFWLMIPIHISVWLDLRWLKATSAGNIPKARRRKASLQDAIYEYEGYTCIQWNIDIPSYPWYNREHRKSQELLARDLNGAGLSHQWCIAPKCILSKVSARLETTRAVANAGDKLRSSIKASRRSSSTRLGYKL